MSKSFGIVSNPLFLSPVSLLRVSYFWWTAPSRASWQADHLIQLCWGRETSQTCSAVHPQDKACLGTRCSICKIKLDIKSTSWSHWATCTVRPAGFTLRLWQSAGLRMHALPSNYKCWSVTLRWKSQNWWSAFNSCERRVCSGESAFSLCSHLVLPHYFYNIRSSQYEPCNTRTV